MIRNNTEAELDIRAKKAILQIIDNKIVFLHQRHFLKAYADKIILHRNRVAKLLGLPKLIDFK